MTTLYILAIWTVVGVGANNGGRTIEHGWRYVGEFAGEQKCVTAGAALGLQQTTFRCLDTGKVTR